MAKASTPNRLLSRLPSDDFGLLKRHLEPIDLPLKERLESPHRTIEHVYFPENGLVSVVAGGASIHGVEVGLIGREGMTGLAVVLGANRSPNETFVQNAGRALRMPATELRKAMERSASLRSYLLRYVHAFLVQVAETAKTNARSKIEERLARRLLMAHDRLNTDEVTITHELLSVMLGVRRSGVTLALNSLERSALIMTDRGVISIIDRTGVKRVANGTYGVAEAEFNRIFRHA